MVKSWSVEYVKVSKIWMFKCSYFRFKSINLNHFIQNSSFYSFHLKFAAGLRESRGRIARVTWRDRGSHVAGSRDTRGGVAGVTGRESRGRVTRVEPC